MDQSKYTKMIDNNNETQLVEADRVTRFLNQGWQIVNLDQKPSQDKPKIKLEVIPTVISKKKSTKKKKEISIQDETAYDITDEIAYDIEDLESNFSSVDYNDNNNNHKEEK